MNNKVFQLNKVRYAIDKNNKYYLFKRFLKNTYGEKSTEEKEINVKGLYHTDKVYSKQIKGDTTHTIVEYPSMILCLYSNDNPIIDDEVSIGDKVFKVTDINNLYEENVILNISLREVTK
jgi:hypothetical protein